MKKWMLFFGLMLAVSAGVAEQVALFKPVDLAAAATLASVSSESTTNKLWNFDDSTPLFDGTAETGTRVYGGMSSSVTVGPIADSPVISLNSDKLVVSVSGGAGYVATIKGLLLWEKGDFLTGSDLTYGFDGTTNSSLSVDMFRHYGNAQWVIRDEDLYYISDVSFTGSGVSSLSGDDAVQWASWDPAANSGADFASVPSSGFASRTFSNVTAVGLYYEGSRNADLVMQFTMNDGGFAADLVVVPEPSIDAVTKFYADFDSATAQDLKVLADNVARGTALDAGTTVGSWTNVTNPNTAFKIVDDGSGNKGLVYDDGGLIADNLILEGHFDSSQDLLSDGTVTTVSFKWMKTDVGGGGGEYAYFEVCNQAGNIVAGLRWDDGTAVGGPITHSENNHVGYSDFTPVFDVDEDQPSDTDPYDPADMISVNMDFTEGSVVYRIDVDLDGIDDLVSTNSILDRGNIENFLLSVKSNNETQHQGAWVDDIWVYSWDNSPPPVSLGSNTVLAVNYSGDTNEVSVLRGYSLSNDSARVFYFDDTVPFFDGNAATGQKIYGGWSGVINTGVFTTADPSISNAGRLNAAVRSDTGIGIGNVLLIWDQDNFINGSSSDTLGFDTTSNSVLSANLFRNDGDAYFVIREGSTYYVSDQAKSLGIVSLAGSDGGKWAAWDPTANGGADFASLPTSGYSARIFSNVTAVGVVSVDYEWPVVGTSSRFTIEGTDQGFAARLITITEGGTPYEDWAAGYPTLTGGPTDDDDGDGLKNLAEYALGGNPTNGIADGGVATVAIAGDVFEVIHARRTDDSSLTYYLELSDSLVPASWTNSGYTVSGTNVTGGTFDYVTNQVPAADIQKFIRLMIESN